MHVILREIALVLDVPADSINLDKGLVENGATSLSLVRLHYALKTANINCKLEHMISGSTVAQLLNQANQAYEPLCKQITRYRKRSAPETIPRLAKQSCYNQSVRPTENSLSRSQVRYPMTEMQVALLESGLKSAGRNIIQYHETHEPESLMALKEAWSEVIRSVPLLSSTYELQGAEAYIVESERQPLDWKEFIVEDATSYVQEIERQGTAGACFGSSFRVVTLKPKGSAPGKSRVIWRAHHALIDGFSHALLLAKLQKAIAKEELETTIPYVHFVAGLHVLQKSSADVAKTYWKKQKLDSVQFSSPLLLPAPSQIRFRLNPSSFLEIQVHSKALAEGCTTIGVTLPALYYAAWALTLGQYTDSQHLCFGTVFSGRSLPIPGCMSIIGPTINALPISIKINPDSTIEEFLQDVFKRVMELNSVQWTTPDHGFTRKFQTALNIRNEPRVKRKSLVPTEPAFNTIYSDVPLQVEVIRGDYDIVRFHYHVDKFDSYQIERIGRFFVTAVNLIHNINSTVDAGLRSLIDNGQQQLLSSLGNWNGIGTKTDSTKDDLVSLFIDKARKYPSIPALRRGLETMTYCELHTKSSLVARHLKSIVDPGAVICVSADRSIHWIIAIYAILKAGAVYCPLVDDLPDSMRDNNFKTSGSTLFVVSLAKDKGRKPSSCQNCISIEELLAHSDTKADEDNEEVHLARPDGAAYLCFTSGSTGNPKGVLCQHRGLVAFQRDPDVRLRANPNWKIAQFMSPAFDGSIHEIFSALSYGGTLVLPEGPMQLNHLKDADAAILTPSVARALDLQSFPGLKVVYFVGEHVTQDLCDSWAAEKTVFNMYGPTEATGGATIKQLFPGNSVNLGAPNPSSRIYILDRHRNLSPVGVVGEIYLAGVQVASGYIGRPEETQSRFFPDSINPGPSERMYKTGDRAYWDKNGELVLVGRADRQVKYRGFRIDLDDLEIRFCRAVSDLIQVAITLVNGELTAYVQPKHINIGKLREALRAHIPNYAMPHCIVPIDTLPMTTAGKRDYKKLEQEIPIAAPPDASLIPIIALEETVISALRDTLRLPANAVINPASSFFELGLSSVSFLFLSHRLSTVLNRKISLRLIMNCGSPRDLALELETCSEAADDAMSENDIISGIERDWWHKYQISTDTSAFNVCFTCELGASVNQSRLASAWNAVLAKHRILSCNYITDNESTITRKYQSSPPKALLMDMIDVDRETHQPFELNEGHLIRVLCSPKLLLVVASHIICDLTALNRILRDVADVYTGRQLKAVLGDHSQVQWHTKPSPSQQAFWPTYLNNIQSTNIIGAKNFKRTSWAGTSDLCSVEKALYDKMKLYAATNHVTMHQLALAAVALALNIDGKELDMIIGAPYLNRNSERELDTIGLFLQPLPIRIKHPNAAWCDNNTYGKSQTLDTETSHAFVRAVQSASRAALCHAMPFDQLLTLLNLPATYPDHDLLNTMVTFLEADHMPILPIPDAKTKYTWTRGAKFRLMAEFAATDQDNLMLRLEYSTEYFSENEISIIGKKVIQALQGLVAETPFTELQDCIRQIC